jgi:hypothetical protein
MVYYWNLSFNNRFTVSKWSAYADTALGNSPVDANRVTMENSLSSQKYEPRCIIFWMVAFVVPFVMILKQKKIVINYMTWRSLTLTNRFETILKQKKMLINNIISRVLTVLVPLEVILKQEIRLIYYVISRVLTIFIRFETILNKSKY